MAKKSKGTAPKGDKYADKAAVAQRERQALDKRWEQPQQKLNRRHRSASLMNGALHASAPDSPEHQLLTKIFVGDGSGNQGLAAWELELEKSRTVDTSDMRPVLFMPTESYLALKQFDYAFNGFPRDRHGPFARQLGLYDPDDAQVYQERASAWDRGADSTCSCGDPTCRMEDALDY